MSNIQTSSDASVVLNNIKILRRFDASEDEFWEHYLTNILQLTKSSFIIVIEEDLSNNQFVQKKILDNSQILENSALLAQITLSNLEKIKKNSYSYEPINFSVKNCSQPYLVSFKIENNNDALLIASIIVNRTNPQQFGEIVVRTQLISDVYSSYKNFLLKKEQLIQTSNEDNSNVKEEKLYEVLELLNLIKNEQKFVLASMKLVNEISLKFDCSRVSLGWKTDEYINTIAVSHLEKFDKKSEIIRTLENIYEECFDQEKMIFLPQEEIVNIVSLAHEEYLYKNKLSSILTIPITFENSVVGVVTLEKENGFFDEKQRILLHLSLSQLSIWLYDLHQKDKWLGKKILDDTKKSLSSFLGSENTFLKFTSLIVTLLLLYSIIFEWEYKIEVTATLDTDDVAFIQAPYDSYIKNVNYFPGDFVKKDEVLVELDEEELLLKQQEMESDVIRFTREAEKARANSELADMNIAIAKVIQSQASLKKVEYFLNQSKISSPFDGIIVEGDKKELLSAPVSKGDMLLKIANAKDMFVRFKISEKYIDEISIDDSGELKLLSRPDLYFPIKITNIVPIAQTDGNNGNIFMLKAKTLGEIESWWRPGMSGVAKINVGKRKVIWIVTHKTIDFLRMYFWL